MTLLAEWLAQWLGVADRADGAMCYWSLTTHWSQFATVWLTLAMILLVAITVRLPLSVRNRVWLVLLRMTALVLLAFLAAEPSLVGETANKSWVAVLIDRSRSLSISDEASKKSRGELLKAWLFRDEVQKQLHRQGDVRYFEFDDHLVPRNLDTSTENSDEQPLAGNATRPGPVLRELLTHFSADLPTNVVVLTDGVASHQLADRLSVAAAESVGLGIPIHTAGIGLTEGASDFRIAGLEIDDEIPLGEEAEVKVYLSGGKGGLKPPIALTAIADDGTVSAIPGEENVESSEAVIFHFQPRAAGRVRLVASIAGGAFAAEKPPNSVTKQRDIVVTERPLTVLLADRLPRYEFRFLKQLLERQPSVELKVWLQDAEPGFVEEDRTALANLPVTVDGWKDFDVIVFGLGIETRSLAPAMLTSLETHISQRGAGILMSCDTLGTNPEISSEIVPWLPARISNGVKTSTGFAAKPNAMSLRWGPFRLDGDRMLSDMDRWSHLPAWMARTELKPIKTGALVLVHEVETDQPLMVWQRFGNGQVMLLAGDESWRWRAVDGETFYRKFWMHTLRWLRAKGAWSQFELNSWKNEYATDESPRFRVQWTDPTTAPPGSANLSVQILRQSSDPAKPMNPPSQEVVLSPVAGETGIWEGVVTPLPEGAYELRCRDCGDGDISDRFSVVWRDREMEQIFQDQNDLLKTAEMTGGTYINLEKEGQLPAEWLGRTAVNRMETERIPLWNRFEIPLLLVLLLGIDWSLRRRLNLF